MSEQDRSPTTGEPVRVRSSGGPERTRLRIVEAAVRLHASVGPARTTISGIAQEAGVQRLTVYRHFPDREALFEACIRWYDERHPVPNVDAWRDEAHPDARLRRALADLYGYWEANESFFANVFRDLAAVPASVTGRLGSTDARMREVLLDGRPGRAVRRRTLEAAIGHALAFETWRSLVRGEGLSRPEAVDLMASFVARA